MRPLGWARIQLDWCPYKEGKFGHTGGWGGGRTLLCTEEGPGEDTRQGSDLQARERSLGGNQACRHFDLGFQAPDP